MVDESYKNSSILSKIIFNLASRSNLIILMNLRNFKNLKSFAL
jgi:hypothetical protein